MPTLLILCRKLGWQIILNLDIEDAVTGHHEIALCTKAHSHHVHPYNAHIYSNCCSICDASTSHQYQNLLAAGQITTNASEHIVHEVPDHGVRYLPH
jgi:hypothetical protein